MTFRLVDVKKTVRARADGRRYLHPKLLGAESAMAVDMALAYFHAHLGRSRRETDPEILVRFFGDAKVARGLVACLGRTYRWRSLDFAEVLDQSTAAWLAAREVKTPGDLRLYLYDQVNAIGDGFLPAEREEHARPLARRLRLTTAKLDQLVALDADEQAVLVRIGPVPDPQQVVSQYNFQVVDAVLRHSRAIILKQLNEPNYQFLQQCCSRHGVVLARDGAAAIMHNQPDAFGSYARHGQRLARALYSAAAATSGLLKAGEALLGTSGQGPVYLFETSTQHALTGRTGAILRAAPLPELRESWDRVRQPAARGAHSGAVGTGGWRLVTNPEPVISGAGLLLAPYACRRDETEVLLWPVESRADLARAQAVCLANPTVLPVLAPALVSSPPDGFIYAGADDGASGVLQALTTYWGGPRTPAAEQALESLLDAAAARGFVEEEQVRTALGCASIDEVARKLRLLDPASGSFVPGLGLCSPTFAATIRKGLRRRPGRVPAA